MKDKLKSAVKKGKSIEKEKLRLESDLEALRSEMEADNSSGMLKAAQGRAQALETDLAASEEQLAQVRLELAQESEQRSTVECLISELQEQLREAVTARQALQVAHDELEGRGLEAATEVCCAGGPKLLLHDGFLLLDLLCYPIASGSCWKCLSTRPSCAASLTSVTDIPAWKFPATVTRNLTIAD